MADRPEPLLVLGTGAMACLFSARLAASGLPIVLLGSWAEGLQALQEAGVRVAEADGREQAYPVRAISHAGDCPETRFALVLVKAWQTPRAAQQLAACLRPNGLALTLQNGLGNYEQLAEVLGGERVALGVTTAGATLLAPGRVRPAGEPVVTLADHPRLPALAELLRAAGFRIDSVPDAAGLVWGKLLINAAINPLTALLGVPNGELLERQPARQLLQSIAGETATVAEALGIRLPYPDPLAAVEAVAHRTAANRSSMLQDVLRHAPTEIDAICGAIVRAGMQAGRPTPVNWTLLQLVQALEGDPPEVENESTH